MARHPAACLQMQMQVLEDVVKRGFGRVTWWWTRFVDCENEDGVRTNRARIAGIRET